MFSVGFYSKKYFVSYYQTSSVDEALDEVSLVKKQINKFVDYMLLLKFNHIWNATSYIIISMNAK